MPEGWNYGGSKVRQLFGNLCIAVVVALIMTIASAKSGHAKINGICGPANGVPTSLAPSSGLCSSGTPSAVTGSGPWIWTCVGNGHGSTSQSCSAPRSAPPPARLTLTFTPAAPSISQDTPLGSYVATVTAAWSDGSPFTGSIVFVAPYNDDGGTFAISGNSIIVNPAGLGVNGDGGTVQNISIAATQ